MGAPSPLGERGAPEEQARAIVARIINFLPGGGPPSGQNPATTQQSRQIRGGRGRVSRWRRGWRREEGGRGEAGGRNHIPPPADRESKYRSAMKPERADQKQKRRTRLGKKRKGTWTEIPQGGGAVEVTRVWGDRPLQEENAGLSVLTPERGHLLLQGVYGDFPYHNGRLHPDKGIADGALWQCRWC